jgi:hypothetical protein
MHELAKNSVCSLPRLLGRGGEGEGLLEPLCMPPPCPSPASGGGDAVAPPVLRMTESKF